MSKRKIVKRAKSKASSRRPTAAALRSRIARVDREILKRLGERARLAEQLGRLRQEQDRPAYDAAFEQKTLAEMVERNAGPLDDRCVRTIFRELVSGSRSLTAPLRVVYLGPEYSYSHLAAIEHFGQSVELVPVATIAAVFEEVSRAQAQFGLVPIENSTDGRIADTLSMFTRVGTRICGEVELPIHHYLLGKCSRAEVREVYSKPQALSQCRDWLAKHLPEARCVEMTSTTAAARLAAQKQGVAAVASLQAGINYELDVIAAKIEDNPNNVTRFAVIGEHDWPRSGNDKTSLMFQVEHRPGSLADAMNVFKRSRLNLTWIESFPIPGVASEYLFFVELEGHEKDARVRRTLASLERKTVQLKVLGSFARPTAIE